MKSVKTFFPEMEIMAKKVCEPGERADDMTADDIMRKLEEMGWRKDMDEAKRLERERKKR